MNQKLLEGKNVIITGAGKNIGRSIAFEMANEGASIFFTDIVEDAVSRLEEELKRKNFKAKGFVCDVSKKGDNKKLLAVLKENGDIIDVLVNNVGIGDDKKATEFDWESWKKILNTNIFGPMHMTRLITREMVKNEISGSVIFITSIHQWVIRRFPAYSSSKAALGMIVKELALELAKNNIRVNAVAPGYVELDNDGNTIPHKYTPMYNSSVHPRYIGRAVVVLASEWFSRHTTGTVVTVDGGLSLYNHLVDEIPLL